MHKVTLFGMIFISSVRYICPSAFAQSPPSGTAVTDPALCFAFFNFQDALAKEIEFRNLSKPHSGNSLRIGAMNGLKMNPMDFDTTLSVARSVIDSLQRLDREALAYKTQVKSRRQKPDFQTLENFHLRRSKLLLSAMTELENGISDFGKKALREYLANEFSKTVRRGLKGNAN
jgi:hypothetical protein